MGNAEYMGQWTWPRVRYLETSAPPLTSTPPTLFTTCRGWCCLTCTRRQNLSRGSSTFTQAACLQTLCSSTSISLPFSEEEEETLFSSINCSSKKKKRGKTLERASATNNISE